MSMSMHDSVPLKLYWWMLTFIFHGIFMCQEMFFEFFSNTLEYKNCYSWATQKQTVGCFSLWAVVCTPTTKSSLCQQVLFPFLNFAKLTDIVCIPTISGRCKGTNNTGSTTWYFSVWKYVGKFFSYPIIDFIFMLEKTISSPRILSSLTLYFKAPFLGYMF